jgi:hypothetical protein
VHDVATDRHEFGCCLGSDLTEQALGRAHQREPGQPVVHQRCPREDSNLRTWFRKPMLYPLSYEGRDASYLATKLRDGAPACGRERTCGRSVPENDSSGPQWGRSVVSGRAGFRGVGVRSSRSCGYLFGVGLEPPSCVQGVTISGTIHRLNGTRGTPSPSPPQSTTVQVGFRTVMATAFRGAVQRHIGPSSGESR